MLEQNESERLTRCMRGSVKGMPLLLALRSDPEDTLEADRLSMGTPEERDERLLRVVELGVDGLIRAGTSVG